MASAFRMRIIGRIWGSCRWSRAGRWARGAFTWFTLRCSLLFTIVRRSGWHVWVDSRYAFLEETLDP